jgi:hypothetical protein
LGSGSTLTQTLCQDALVTCSAVAGIGERSNDDGDAVESTTPSYLLSVELSTLTETSVGESARS